MITTQKGNRVGYVRHEDKDFRLEVHLAERGQTSTHIAFRDETITVIHGTAAINGKIIGEGVLGVDAKGIDVRRGEQVRIEVRSFSPFGYKVEYGPKIFHPVFATTL